MGMKNWRNDNYRGKSKYSETTPVPLSLVYHKSHMKLVCCFGNEKSTNKKMTVKLTDTKPLNIF
jgi:hypothetical protein